MYLPKITEKTQKGFSLIELLLVIFIISLVYYLGFSMVEKEKKRKILLTPLKLKEAITHNNTMKKQGTLICTNNCTECYFKEGYGAAYQPYSGKIDLSHITAYTLDADNRLVTQEYGRFKRKKVCLYMRFYPNGSSTPIVLEDEKGIYFLPSFFGEAAQVDSLNKARDLWLREEEKIRHAGAFY